MKNESTLETVILVVCRHSKVLYTNVVVEESPNLILGIFFPWGEPLIAQVIAKAAIY